MTPALLIAAAVLAALAIGAIKAIRQPEDPTAVSARQRQRKLENAARVQDEYHDPSWHAERWMR
jgi:histidine ammonia-lyase